MQVEWSAIGDADIIAVGSILDQLPTGWAGTIIGAGKLHGNRTIDLTNANVLALRGRLSAHGVHGDYAIGDPGLLCSEFVQRPWNSDLQYDLTVVPHWSDTTLAARYAHLNPHVVDPAADSLTVIREIANSKKVVASSLHGIVIADSFRIPRRAERFPNIDAHYEGGEFKYHDYASALDGTIRFGELHTPDPRYIDRAQAELFDAFRSLTLRHERVDHRDDDTDSQDRRSGHVAHRHGRGELRGVDSD